MNKKELLMVRAGVLEAIRTYFKLSDVLEVQTPVLSFSGNTDPHIDSFTTLYKGIKTQLMYLQTSPEFFMKRLLCEGSGSIYQICPSFRQAEEGPLHNPEFMLLEWYRIGFDYHELISDVIHLMNHLFGQALPVQIMTYHQVFEPLGIAPHRTCVEQLRSKANDLGVSLQSSEQMSKDDWLSLLMTHLLEPSFDKDKLTFVIDFPASQASLAKIRYDDDPVAERFELYWGGMELANGFTELQDADEQRKRFQLENDLRAQAGQAMIPMDEAFLQALELGLPSCSGVALGLDRLFMKMLQVKRIKESIVFDVTVV